MLKLNKIRWLPTATLLLIAGSIFALNAGCASSRSGSGQMARYMDPPKRVWQTIQLTMEEFEYEIESDDPLEGKMRAVSAKNPDVVLVVDQVMRSGTVSVYVRSEGCNEGDQAVCTAVVDEFMTELDARIWGRKQ
ncbi:MAG: hypothetical protein GY906_28560 [bacterium]|nr:hypothetical protein [bacterium]